MCIETKSGKHNRATTSPGRDRSPADELVKGVLRGEKEDHDRRK